MIVFVLLIASAFLMFLVTICGWSVSQGLQPVQLFYIVIYLVFAYYVTRWNRGVLATVSGLALILIVFTTIAGIAWFGRDKALFADALLPDPVMGFLTLLIVPLQMLVIAFALQGMRQEWNVEEGAPIQDEPVHGEAHPPQAA